MTLYQLRAEAFTGDDLRLLLAVAPKTGLAIRNALYFESAATAAETDELTGLPNARFLFSWLQKEVANVRLHSGALGVAVMDLDHFKPVNDRYGHLTGDRILQTVASALRRNCGPGDLVARLGGDEFVLVTPASGTALREKMDRMIRIVGDLAVEGVPGPSIGLSAGVSSFPNDGLDAETLLEKADDRMYEAKRRKQILRVA